MGEFSTEEGRGRLIGDAQLCCGEAGYEGSGLLDGQAKLDEIGLFVKSFSLSNWKCLSKSSDKGKPWFDEADRAKGGGDENNPKPMASKSPEMAPERRWRCILPPPLLICDGIGNDDMLNDDETIAR